MPTLIPAGLCRCLPGPTPALLIPLLVAGPCLPVLALGPGGEPAALAGWTVTAKRTLVALDGPGEEGFLVPTVTDPGQLARATAWARAVVRAGAAIVLQADAAVLGEDIGSLLRRAGMRGGVVRERG